MLYDGSSKYMRVPWEIHIKISLPDIQSANNMFGLILCHIGSWPFGRNRAKHCVLHGDLSRRSAQRWLFFSFLLHGDIPILYQLVVFIAKILKPESHAQHGQVPLNDGFCHPFIMSLDKVILPHLLVRTLF